jgi:hypothetical protein
VTQSAQQRVEQEPTQQSGHQVAELLLTGAATALLAKAVWKLLAPFGVTLDAVALALHLADRGTNHQPRMVGTAELTRDQRRQEAQYRAWYVINASKRLTASLRNGDTPRAAVGREAPYWRLHEAARKARMAAAAQVAEAASRFGPVLGWWAHPDDKTTPACRAADGHNFSATVQPRIGWPGQPHAGRCRCVAGPPFEPGRSVDQVTTGLAHL